MELVALGYPNYHFIKGDINDAKLIDEIIKKVDFVVHLTAIVGEAHVKKIQRKQKIQI